MWRGGKILKCSESSFNAFIFKVKYTSPALLKKKVDDKISIPVVD
jgi:hypothetical protein